MTFNSVPVWLNLNQKLSQSIGFNQHIRYACVYTHHCSVCVKMKCNPSVTQPGGSSDCYKFLLLFYHNSLVQQVGDSKKNQQQILLLYLLYSSLPKNITRCFAVFRSPKRTMNKVGKSVYHCQQHKPCTELTIFIEQPFCLPNRVFYIVSDLVFI